MKNKYYTLFCIMAFIVVSFRVNAETQTDAYELVYEEQETGTDPYRVKFTISNRFIRIDQLGDESGYVIYDDKEHVIHSVAHHDESVLLIPEYEYQKPDLTKQVIVKYFSIPDAPKISGQDTYGYRVTDSSGNEEKCMDIILAESLLPEVTAMFVSYQKILAGQQSRLLTTTPKEYQTSCFLSDQVFNEGDYYQKGLPIQEWHSNGKNRLLVSYKKVKVDLAIFRLEENYRKYSLDGLTKTD